MHQDFVLLAAHPLIDIDLTVVIQFALFLIMFVIGNVFLFQPYLKLRERRKQGIDGARAEAERMSAQADAELADYEKKLAQARARANDRSREVSNPSVVTQAEIAMLYDRHDLPEGAPHGIQPAGSTDTGRCVKSGHLLLGRFGGGKGMTRLQSRQASPSV